MPQLNKEEMGDFELSLDPERLEVFEQLIAKYERDWHRDSSISWQDYLPEDSQLRTFLIAELPEIEAEFRRGLAGSYSSKSRSEPGPVSSTATADADSSRSDRAFRAAANFEQVIREIRGGLGDVFVIRDVDLNRVVVVKQLQARWLGNARAERAFQREVEFTSKLEHPCVVPVHSVGKTQDGRPFYSMRYVHGQTLQQAIDTLHRAERFDTNLFRNLLTHFIQICRTIAFANSRNIIHRDLKPSNIVIGEFGQSLVLDWGLAKELNSNGKTDASSVEIAPSDNPLSPAAYDEDDYYLITDSQNLSCETAMGEIIGTPGFMSPEQALGQVSEYSVRTDVFGLGGVLFALLTGRPPFVGRDVSESISLAAECKLDFGLVKQRDSLTRGVTAICRKAMSAEPAMRYEDAQALADDLEAWLAGQSISIQLQPLMYRAGRFMMRQRTLAAATVFFLIATIGAIVVGVQAVQAAKTRTLLAEGKSKATQLAAENVAAYIAKIYRTADSTEFDDPNFSPDNATARAALIRMLDSGYQLMNVELKQHAETYGDLLLSMGTGYRAVGLNDKSRELLAEAVELHLNRYGPKDLRTLECKYQLARSDYDQGNYQQSETSLKSIIVALDQTRPISSTADKEVLRRRNLLMGNVKLQLAWLQILRPLDAQMTQFDPSRIENSRRLFTDVVELRRRFFPDQPRSIGLAYAGLASALACSSGKEAEAISAATSAMETFNVANQERSFDSFSSEFGRAEEARRAGDFDRAERLYQQLSDFIEGQVGPSHPLVTLHRWHLARFYRQFDRNEKADMMIEMAKSKVKDYPAIRSSMITLDSLRQKAELLIQLDRKSEAYQTCAEMLKFAKDRPAEHAELIRGLEGQLEDLHQAIAKNSNAD